MDESLPMPTRGGTSVYAGAFAEAARRDVVRELGRVRLDVAFIDQLLVESGDALTKRMVVAALGRLDDLILQMSQAHADIEADYRSPEVRAH